MLAGLDYARPKVSWRCRFALSWNVTYGETENLELVEPSYRKKFPESGKRSGLIARAMRVVPGNEHAVEQIRAHFAAKRRS